MRWQSVFSSFSPVADLEPPKGYSAARRRAEKVVVSDNKLALLTKTALEKLQSTGTGQGKFQAVRHELGLMMGLIKAYVAGEYRDVSSGVLLGLVAALIYFVNPLDVIPDFILVFGLLDDAAVIGYVVSLLRSEIDLFEKWQKSVGDEGQSDEIEPDGN